MKLHPDAAKCADFAVEILQFLDDEEKNVPGHGHIHTNTQIDNKSKKVTGETQTIHTHNFRAKFR